MKITDVMRTPAITVKPEASLHEALLLMVHHDITELPVVDQADGLVGILGEADLYRARLEDHQTRLGKLNPSDPYRGRLVGDLMRRPVIFVEVNDSLTLAQLRLMGQARSLPVLDGSTVIGLIDRQVLLKHFAQTDGDGREEPGDSAHTAPDPPASDHKVVDVVTAETAMSRHVVSVTEDQTLAEVWTLMSQHKVHHIAVLDAKHCVGIIDDRQIAAFWPAGPTAMQTTAARSLAGRRVATVLASASLSDAAKIIHADGGGAVPVVNSHGQLLGLLTATDIVEAVARWGVGGTGTQIVTVPRHAPELAGLSDHAALTVAAGQGI